MVGQLSSRVKHKAVSAPSYGLSYWTVKRSYDLFHSYKDKVERKVRVREELSGLRIIEMERIDIYDELLRCSHYTAHCKYIVASEHLCK